MSTTDNNMRFINRTSLDKFYRNSRNNIEDPIFTGFTFDIDILNSPLFFSLCSDEYAESLRSIGGKNGKEGGLADKIEKKLKNAYEYHIGGSPDSYEINTTYTKDELGTDHRAGYGLQERYYMDKPIYGAVDYIYMVDKVSIGKFSDDIGVTDLGSGLTRNFYRDASNTAKEYWEDVKGIENITPNFEYDGSEDDWVSIEGVSEKDALKKKIEELTNEINKKEIVSEHERNEKAYKDADKEYNDALVKFKFEEKTSELEELKNNVDEASYKINKVLNDAKEEASRCLNILNSSTSGKKQAADDASKAFDDLCKYFTNGNNDVISSSNDAISAFTNKKFTISLPKDKESKVTFNLKFNVPTTKQIEDELKNIDEKIVSSYKSAYEMIYFIQNLKLSEKKLDDKKNEKIKELQDDIASDTEKIYGKHSDGRLGTISSPAEGSVYKNYLDAENKKNEDKFSQIQNQIDYLNDILNKYSEVVQYRENYVTNTVEVNDMPIARNEGDTDEEFYTRLAEDRDTRETFEVPQTVYDMLGFINGMKDITNKYPYTLQSVSGLDVAYKKYFEVKDPYMGSGDETISIECLDYLDLKVSSMFNKYFNAVYDHQYRRERVPINLRRFNCSIFVHDIRNFKNSLNGDLYVGGSDLKPLVEMALNYVSAIEFKFYDCEFIPEETGGIFENVSNVSYSEPAKTKFTFRYGNCVINFLPFEDLRKYLFGEELKDIKSKVFTETIGSSTNDDNKFTTYADDGVDDGNFRRWFDKSVLGNVGNNDYRDYVRNDSSVVVDDHFKTTIVNNFALNSVVNKNQELTQMDDVLRRIVVGISASTGIPVPGVTDALNIRFINPILNDNVYSPSVVQDIGNVNSNENNKPGFIDFLGNVNEDKKEKDGK